MAEFIQVSTTVNSERNAMKIAEVLLEGRMASCVQILGPIKSKYRWSGKIEQTREWMCLIKARGNDYRKIESAIKKMHDYEVPEIVALPILQGDPDYLDWITRETKRRSKQKPKGSLP
jgi:periplasmic divalent cation tolerance protein